MSISKTNEDAVKFLSGNNSLLDSTMTSFAITKTDDRTAVEIQFLTRPSAAYRCVRLVFEQVVEVGFYYSSKHIFYNVENIKLLITDVGDVYISLDPDETQAGCSDNDQDFVRARSLMISAW